MAKKAKAKKKSEGIDINVGVCAGGVKGKFREITVTKKHIKDGEEGDASSCAIALAVQDMLTEYGLSVDNISVGGSSSSFRATKEIEIPVTVCGEAQDPIRKMIEVSGELNLSKSADKFIEMFDEDKKSVKPTTFKAKPEITITVEDSY